MKHVNQTLLAVVISSICVPVLAQLHGAELDAAKAYFAAHPDIPSDKEVQILNAESLYTANEQLAGYSYYNQRTGKNVYPGFITPIPDATATSLTENIPATETKPALKAGMTEEQGTALTNANVERTSSQKKALETAQLEQLQAERGDALTQSNIDRTAVQKLALKAAQLHQLQQLKGESLTQSNVERTAIQKTALEVAQLEQQRLTEEHTQVLTLANINEETALVPAQFNELQEERGAALTEANLTRTASEHPDAFAIQALVTLNAQDELEAQQNVAINKAQLTANLATAKTDDVIHAIDIAQADIKGAVKQAAIQNGERVQGMLHAKQQAETNATVKAAVDAVPTSKPVSKDIAVNHSAIKANKTAIETTQGDVQKLAKQQQVQSVYYSQQIQTLATNQGEVLTAVNNNYAANRATQSQVDSNTQQINKLNSNFSNLKNEVNENKKQASAGISGAMAQANIPQVLQGQTFAVGAGIGGYDGQSAVAVGFSARVSQSVTVKATVSDDTAQNAGYGAGVSIGF
ncbi:YadA-like family protein [Citrobacter freundii]|nr:YadA-like family protein [Citrobacter freundii]EKU2551185.1 YadA-like family protein [Citrobacter freundii]